jgi:hypothetical protein
MIDGGGNQHQPQLKDFSAQQHANEDFSTIRSHRMRACFIPDEIDPGHRSITSIA